MITALAIALILAIRGWCIKGKPEGDPPRSPYDAC